MPARKQRYAAASCFVSTPVAQADAGCRRCDVRRVGGARDAVLDEPVALRHRADPVVAGSPAEPVRSGIGTGEDVAAGPGLARDRVALRLVAALRQAEREIPYHAISSLEQTGRRRPETRAKRLCGAEAFAGQRNLRISRAFLR